MRRLHLPIQNPCHEDWTAMNDAGDGRRFCDVCTKHVHDLSTMTEQTARAVLAEESAKGRVCVRYKLDADGHIKFKPRTVEAPSVWRMSLAAAGLALTMLTGCADAEPDRVLHDRCVYEVGPWSFTAERGQGTCPEPEIELMGDVAIEPEPEPEPTVKGEIAEPMPMGEIAVEPEPPVEPPIMGKIAIEPEPPVIEREVELMGDVAVAPEQPCDPAKKAKAAKTTNDERGGPRRL